MTDFIISGNELVIKTDLTSPMDVQFDIACRKLLDAEGEEIVIDLVAVKRIISQYLGGIALVAAEAKKSGRRLKIRAAAGHVAEVFQTVGFDRLMEIEVVDPGSG